MCRAGETRVAAAIGSKKARTLLAVLGLRCGQWVTVNVVADALWGDRPPRRPVAGVATLVSRLRAGFGQEVIVGAGSGYRLGEAVEVDVHHAEALIAEAERALRSSEASNGRRKAEEALELISGAGVLTDQPAGEWVERARRWHAELLRRAWHVAAEGALGTGDPERARAVAEIAIAADPLDEAAYRALMEAYVAAGEPARAVLAYQRLRAELTDELGIDPAESTRALHLAILRGSSATELQRPYGC
ncbi:BTAD domain-containing putative transcriptional regulator [Lentzea sp. NPDC051838]|uniref:AfsR/SARP family transcriptional regulator n=1 Tax=Lentzea sp. NPDC051838 TaxID=3154849 RepID=UPI00342F9B24